MPRILTLPPEHAHKIAAGQVVERPASIVKELIENSLDAGATKIILTLEDGGKKLIRVQDNGHGMDYEDAQACFGKHATSKLRSFEELSTIATFGFRGEALPSIAAVSKVTLITREHHTQEGTKVEITDSTITNIGPAAAQPGTDIAIRDLFGAIPARKKFLKKRETELNHIQDLFKAFCLHHQYVHFILHSDGKELINCPPANNLVDRFAQLNDHALADQLLTIQSSRATPAIEINGVISDYQSYRYDRSEMFFFVNSRWVKNFILSKALLKGYKNTLGQGKFPRCVVHITIDPLLVDINIHPRKEEVLFMHPHMVEDLISSAVTNALEKKLSHHLAQPIFNPTNISVSKQSVPAFNFDSWFRETSVNPIPTPASFIPKEPSFVAIPHQSKVTQEPLISDEKFFLQTHASPELYTPLIIGQFHKTYILIEKEEGLFIVDQHAAHERVLYEEFKKRFTQLPTINLMFPLSLELSLSDMTLLESHIPLINQHGIGIELLGPSHLSITSTPIHLKNANITAIIHDIIGYIKEHDKLQADDLEKKLHEEMHAQMACKAAVKAGDTLSLEAMKELIADLYKTENRFACPHGRPTGWLLSTKTFEKEFRRDYRP